MVVQGERETHACVNTTVKGKRLGFTFRVVMTYILNGTYFTINYSMIYVYIFNVAYDDMTTTIDVFQVIEKTTTMHSQTAQKQETLLEVKIYIHCIHVYTT